MTFRLNLRVGRILFALAAFLLVASQPKALADDYRLSPSVSPKSYDLSIAPNMTSSRFGGQETIDIAISAPQKELVLNSLDLEITLAELRKTDGSGARISIQKVVDKKRERIKFIPARELSKGNYSLHLVFTGKFNEQLRGFYKAKAKNEKGKESFLAVTQFEPTDARRMFPCFDEPAFKATFKLSADIEKESVAISNAPVLSVKELGETKHVEFETTPKMSTYLLALFIGPFLSTEAVVDSDGVPVRVFSVGHKPELGNYARDVAVKLLPYYQKYFGTDYMGKKLDLIAIPDFEAGAMENLGAISFRENALLFDESKDSLQSQMSITGVIAHEMAHLWFGDLVTMVWWDDLWLNEAFATWMSHKGEDYLKPEWRSWDQLAEARDESMSTDALKSSRAIHADVKDPVEALQMFDDITYSKGASIIRMLEEYVGEESFQKGVAKYIDAHKFSNAKTKDLWDAIGLVSQKPISTLMHGWVEQAGFPVVKIENGAASIFSQKRFFANPKIEETTLWETPIGCRQLQSSSEAEYILLKEASMSTTKLAPHTFANAYGSGYFRVAYPKEELNSFEHDSMTPRERYSVLSDQWALASSGRVPMETYLDFLLSFRTESDPFVISKITEQLDEIWIKLPKSANDDFAKFARSMLLQSSGQLGWTEKQNEDDWTKLARTNVLVAMGTIGQDKATIQQARTFFQAYRNHESVPANALPAIFAIVSFNGDKSTYDQILECWHNAVTPTTKNRALFSLSNFQEQDLIERTLSLSLTDAVRIQDSPHLLSRLISNREGYAIAWPFAKNHWFEIVKKFPPYSIPALIGANSIVKTESAGADFKSFFEKHPVPEGSRDFARTQERIANNIYFESNCLKPTLKWISNTLEKKK
jgi:puromycin-sensitive aminopeptidase